ncbi:MAG: type VII secretion target [Actinophytocola sp.]|uniref:type VII secretion target n=1 Tax=Actinophytocola sp. TaxID=1872138 RepID=UPI003C73A718
MTDYFDVDASQLQGHAGSVGDIADQLSTIGGRMPTGLADLALGLFGQFMMGGLKGAMSQVTDTVGTASSSVSELSSGISRTAAVYHGTDENNATNLTQQYPG